MGVVLDLYLEKVCVRFWKIVFRLFRVSKIKKKIKSNEYQLLSNLQTMQCTCNSVQLKQRISILKRSNFKNTRLKTKLCSSEDSTSLYNHQF